MENIEDPGCRDALAILQDVLQLCELLRGNSESCSFNSRNCSDCFTGIAMQHLCAPDPDKSLPRQALLPMIEKIIHGGGGQGANSVAAAAAATEAAKLSMALVEERNAGMAELQTRVDEQAMNIAAKDAEVQALLAKNAALARALDEKQQGKAQSAGASLVQSGVQVTRVTNLTPRLAWALPASVPSMPVVTHSWSEFFIADRFANARR